MFVDVGGFGVVVCGVGVDFVDVDDFVVVYW